MPSLVFTGGGTTGHVTKNLVIIEEMQTALPQVERHYLGLKTGKEASLVTAEVAQFHPISSGKLRRYFSLQTIPDFFRFLAGIWQSFWLLGSIKPALVFSSGGFVALPVALAARLRSIPVITHETDSYPGLANRLIGKVAEKILLGYHSAEQYLPKEKCVYVGNPVSKKLFHGSREKALKTLGFDEKKPVLMVMGGSQGAQQINELVWEILPELVKEWQIIHLTGKGKFSEFSPCLPAGRNFQNQPSYKAFEYVKEEYGDFLTASDLLITRGGGNSLAEIAALGKSAIVIPLPLPAAAGDHQRKNAEEMQKTWSDWQILNDPTHQKLLEAVQQAPKISKEPQMPEKLPQEAIVKLFSASFSS